MANEKKLVIDGVFINRESEEIQEIETAEDIDELGIFDKFNKGAKERATDKLLVALGKKDAPEKKAETPNPPAETMGLKTGDAVADTPKV